MSFNKNGSILITSFEDLSIKIWDISKNKHGNKNKCHETIINCLSLS